MKRTLTEVARLRKKTKRSGAGKQSSSSSAASASAADREMSAQLEAATGVRSGPLSSFLLSTPHQSLSFPLPSPRLASPLFFLLSFAQLYATPASEALKERKRASYVMLCDVHM